MHGHFWAISFTLLKVDLTFHYVLYFCLKIHNKNALSVKKSRRKKDNQAAFHISYKNISKKQLTYPYILHPFLAKMLQFIHDLAYFYDHHWPFQKPFLFLEREHQELTNCDMPCHLSVFKEKGKGKWQILLHILLLKYGIQNVQIYVCVWALEYDTYF